MIEHFPLCKKAGLSILNYTICAGVGRWIQASDVESLLANAPVVVSQAPDVKAANIGWYREREHLHDKYNFSARLLLIEPIKRDSAESVLRDLVAYENKISNDIYGKPNTEYGALMERARKLLDAGKERK
jgi:hypothetical protein